jgi:hypothetical protein
MNIIKFKGRGKIESLLFPSILINGNTATPQHQYLTAALQHCMTAALNHYYLRYR